MLEGDKKQSNQRKHTVTLIELQKCLGLKLVGNICDNVSTQFNNTYNIALVETVSFGNVTDTFKYSVKTNGLKSRLDLLLQETADITSRLSFQLTQN